MIPLLSKSATNIPGGSLVSHSYSLEEKKYFQASAIRLKIVHALGRIFLEER